MIQTSVVSYTNKEALVRLRTLLAMANSDYVVRDQTKINALRNEINRIQALNPDGEYVGEKL